MDNADFIESLILYANESPACRQSAIDDMVEWRDAAYAALRAGAGKSVFDVTSSTQHGKSISGQVSMTNQEAFVIFTNAIARLKTAYAGSITLADFSGMSNER